MMDKNYSTLIIDSSDAAQFTTPSERVRQVLAKSGEDAKSAILDSKKHYAAIFINPVLTKPGIVSLLSLIHKHRPATPIYLLHEDKPPFTPQEMVRLAIVDSIQKPLTDHAIQKLLSDEIFSFNDSAPDESTTARPTEDPEYSPVQASGFLAGTPSFFDIFVRLPSGRYVKILDARDSLSPPRAKTYLEKGVYHFFIKKEAQKRCLTYCDILSKSIINNPEISFEVKVSEAMNQGEAVITAIQEQGLKEEQFDSMFNYLANVHMLIKKMGVEKQASLQSFLTNVHAYDHAVSTTMVASLLTIPLKIESQKAFESVGLASFLHDIALYQMSPVIQSQETSQMNEEELKLYHSHPTLGAEIVSKFPNVDSITRQAIAQHHERRNNTGFPGRASGAEINRVAEIVGISDEFVRLVEKAKKNPLINYLNEMEKKVFDGFSFPVIEAFRGVFLKKK